MATNVADISFQKSFYLRTSFLKDFHGNEESVQMLGVMLCPSIKAQLSHAQMTSSCALET
jgi:hypothetical protein